MPISNNNKKSCVLAGRELSNLMMLLHLLALAREYYVHVVVYSLEESAAGGSSTLRTPGSCCGMGAGGAEDQWCTAVMAIQKSEILLVYL